MKPLAQLDHYELLEVPRGASQGEIERAYRLALETWADDSLAVYSIAAAGDAAALRQRVQAAYRTLRDADSRRDYDDSTRPPGQAPAAEAVEAAPERSPVDEPFDELEGDDAEWSGARLRRRRLHRGLELDEIASATKVNPGYLRCLEEERFAELPARVYVRGFVCAYASCLGLDADAVARSYLKRFEDGRRPARRRRSR